MGSVTYPTQPNVPQSATVTDVIIQLSSTQQIQGLCMQAVSLVKSICTKINQTLWKGAPPE